MRINITSSSFSFWLKSIFIVISMALTHSVNAQQPVDGFPYTDSFKFPTSPGTILGGANDGNNSPTTLGSAFLTSSPTAAQTFGSLGTQGGGGTNQLTALTADASGGGYLRLTRSVQQQTGYARNIRTFPTADGLSISFEYYTYGGSGADGIVFFLYDADVVNRGVTLGYASAGFNVGAYGGSLGYAQRTDNGTGGLSKGFLGIGFDEFGNFGLSLQGRQGGYSGPAAVGSDRISNWVTLRGDGDGATNAQPGFGAGSNYEYLIGVNTVSGTAVFANASTATVNMGGGPFNIAGGTAPASRTAGLTTTDPAYRKARINIKHNNSSNFTINVYITAGSVERHVIQNYTYVPTVAAPLNLSYGFSSSTGGSTNVHEIRAIDIRVPPDVLKVPVATAATTTTLEDTPVVIDMTTYAYDQNGNDQLNWATALDLDPTIPGEQASRTIPSKGTFIANASGTVTFTPEPDYHGTVSTDYTIADFGNLAASPTIPVSTSNAASLTITVISVNDPPVAASKTVTINEDTDYTFTAADFALTDPFDNPVNALSAIQITTIPASGTLRLGGVTVVQGATITIGQINAASFTYRPPANTSASPMTSFTFRVQDDGLRDNGGIDVSVDAATMTINVLPANDAPSGADKTITINEDTPYTLQEADFGFTDLFDNPQNTFISVLVSLPTAGSLTLGGVPLPGSTTISTASLTTLQYVPPLNASGTPTASFTFQVRDNGGIVNGGVDLDPLPKTITFNVLPVNDPPVAVNDVGTVIEDVTLTVLVGSGLLSNDTDPDASTTLTVSKYTVAGLPGDQTTGGPFSIPGVGSITINSDGSYSFNPVLNFVGVIPVITYTVTDGTLTDEGTLTLTITPVNDPPVAVNDVGTVIEDVTLTVLVGSGLLSNDTDPDASTTLTVSKYTVAGLPGDQTTGGPFSIPGVGSITINSDGSYSFNPVLNFVGVIPVITYTVTDGTLTDEGTLTLTITPVNDSPSFVKGANQSVLTTAGAQTVTGWATSLSKGPADEVAQNLTFTVTNSNNSLFTVQPAISPTGVLTYTPSGIVGTATVTVVLKDDGGILNGGSDTFTSQTFTITITAPSSGNTPPVANNDSYNTVKGGTLNITTALGVLVNDTDTESNPLKAAIVSLPAHGTLTLNPNGSFTYVHDNGASTSDSFTYRVNDGIVDGNVATVSINVSASNTPPVIADIAMRGTIDQPVQFAASDFVDKFTDSNLDPLNKIKVVTTPPSGVLKLNGVDIIAGQEIPFSELGKITFIPPAGFSGGPISFQWNGSDGIDYAAVSKNVNITIDPTSISINVTEVCIGDVPWVQYVITGQGFTPAANSATIQWKKMDGTVVRELTNQPLTGQLLWPGAAVDANGIPTAWPGWNFTGGQWVQISDGLRPQMRLHISINPETEVIVNYPPATPFCSANPNRPPVVTNITKSSTGFLPVTFTANEFTDKFSDPDQDPLVKVRIITLPPNGVLKLNGITVSPNQEIPVADLGTLTFEPALNWSGTTNFTWNGSDGDLYALNPANAALTVVLPSDPNAKIGLAKNLASVTPALNGTYDIKFVFTAVNFGLNGLDNISIKDNLALAFGGTEVTVKSVTAFGNLKANTDFNGSSNTELLLPSSRLTAGEEAKVELLINVRLLLASGVFQNTATAEGISSLTGFKVTDVSTNGLRPDPNSTGDVSPSEATPIKLDPMPTYVPAGFSPNGDGMNDKFVVQNANGKHVSLEMYNRWGNRVYKSDDYKNDWGGEVTEGFFLGRDIPDGTYYYIIIIDKKDKYAGFITVNR